MQFEIRTPETWENLNDQVKQELGLPAEQIVRVYKGLPHAVFETVVSLAQFTSHKKSMAWFKGNTPIFERSLSWLFKEAYQVQELLVFAATNNTSENPNDNKTDATVAKDVKDANTVEFKKDLAFVLMSADHPITGECFDAGKQVESLNQQKVFSIVVHHLGLIDQNLTELSPWEIHLYRISDDLCVMRAGSRFKGSPLLAPDMSWDIESILKKINLEKNRKSNENAVKKFENHLPAGCSALSKLSTSHSNSRIYDRAVFVVNNQSAELVRAKLIQHFDPSLIETTNMCRWNAMSRYKFWWDNLPTDDELAKLLIVSSELLEKSDFVSHLSKLLDSQFNQQNV
jgi:hypothetical protein